MKYLTRLCLIILLSYSVSGWAQNTELEADNIVPESTSSNLAEDVKEKKYVTDKLRLSLYREPNSGSGTIRLLISGDVLFVLERNGPYSKVRTEDGATGWVKNGFLQNDATSTFQLLEVQDENESLIRQIDKYADTAKMVAEFEQSIDQLKADKSSLEQELQQLKDNESSLSNDNSLLQQKLEQNLQVGISLEELVNELKKYWHILALVILLIFTIGLIVGKGILEARVRRRFQGIKVW